MRDDVKREAWGKFLREFSDRNKSRPTWLQVFGDAGAQSEELGLPLMGLSLEERNGKAPSVQIMLGGHDSIEPLHLTHVINQVQQVKTKVGNDGRDEAVEFIDAKGEASLLIFRHRARMAAHAS
jgi:hypothetical protein